MKASWYFLGLIRNCPYGKRNKKGNQQLFKIPDVLFEWIFTRIRYQTGLIKSCLKDLILTERIAYLEEFSSFEAMGNLL